MARFANFTVTVDPDAEENLVVNYATRNGTALSGVHYTAKTGTLTFGVGETTKVVSVTVDDDAGGGVVFYLDVSWQLPNGNTVSRPSGSCTIGIPLPEGKYLTWFQEAYALMKNPATGYFGPPTGAKAFQYPYHSIEKLLVEAPDAGHQSVSETISFWGKLEAWKIALTGDKSGYETMWSRVEANFIPAGANQIWGDYTDNHTADYQPEQDLPSGYPVMAIPFPVGAGSGGADPLYTALVSTYGTKNVYLMHWMIDVDGDYGFLNPDGATKGVFVNSYQRGMQESTWECVTHPEFENFANGGSAYGYMPLFGQNLPLYPAAGYPYSKQIRYTVAPDAEARLIQASYLANKFAAEHSTAVASQDSKAKKMGDYLRYCLYDKYFHKGAGVDGTGNSNLIGWYVSFGMDATQLPPAWGFRISSSNYHQGYQAPDIAYMMSLSGGGYSPLTAGAAVQWQNSMLRQLEFIRWLQTPEGPIAGGASNSWKGRYETPTDGREVNTFYGMYYTYAPEWHDPPSNNWFGFQVWGLERLALLYTLVADKTGTFNTETRAKCEVILDRWVNWLLDNAMLGDPNTISLPINLGWTSPTQVVGETTSVANNEGVFEYLPSLNWPGTTPDYGAFWNASNVPNPNLKCTITGSGLDIGSAAGAAQILVQYAQAKRKSPGGSLGATIPLGSHTVQDALDLAVGIMDRIHDGYADAQGFTKPEERLDYNRFNDELFIPAGFTGNMPNGDVIAPGVKFIDVRTFMKTWPGWSSVQAYIDGGAAPVFTYHRFWHTSDIAVSFAMLHYYFADVLYETP